MHTDTRTIHVQINMLNRESTMHDGGIPGTIKQRSACQLQRMTSIGKSNMGPLQVKASSIDRYKQMIYDNLTDMTPICAVARKRSKSFRLQNLLKNNMLAVTMYIEMSYCF